MADSSDLPREPKVTATGYRSHAYYMPAELHERLKAAWWATRDQPDGAPSLSGKVEQLFLDECIRLEAEYNAGAPFAPAPKNARGMNPAAARRQGTFMEQVWSSKRGETE